MKITFRRELVMTSEERETIKKIMNILKSDDNLDSRDCYDVLISIADEDYETLQEEYDYYVEIRD